VTPTVTLDPEATFAKDVSGCLCYHVCSIQELLGHNDVNITILYTHVLNKAGRGVRIQADLYNIRQAVGPWELLQVFDVIAFFGFA